MEPWCCGEPAVWGDGVCGMGCAVWGVPRGAIGVLMTASAPIHLVVIMVLLLQSHPAADQ